MIQFFIRNENPEPKPVILYPGKVPLNGQPHVLDVGEDDMAICHTDDCMDACGEIMCDVAYAQDMGFDGIWHVAEVSESGERLTDGLIPGEYWIEFRVVGEWEDEEVFLELMYPEEAEEE